jgi:hypothetical protein
MVEHQPTDKTQAQVQQASGLGLPHDQIAALIGISDKTLRKHYAIELALGKAQASASVAKSLYNKAIKGDTTAMIWWTKAQMKWSETVKQEITGENGEALIPSINISFVKPKNVGETA